MFLREGPITADASARRESSQTVLTGRVREYMVKVFERVEDRGIYDGAFSMKNTQVARLFGVRDRLGQPATAAPERIPDRGKQNSTLTFACASSLDERARSDFGGNCQADWAAGANG
jgi:hypothetical protein